MCKWHEKRPSQHDSNSSKYQATLLHLYLQWFYKWDEISVLLERTRQQCKTEIGESYERDTFLIHTTKLIIIKFQFLKMQFDTSTADDDVDTDVCLLFSRDSTNICMKPC